MRSSHLHLVIFLISAFIIIPQDSKSQTRKLRLAAENLREDKTEEALQNILKYEEKEGEQAPGLYLRYLYSLKTAKGTEGIETAYTMLNKAYTRLESADSKDADEWCSEIGFCISGKATDLNTVELMLFKAYTSDLDLSRINSFIMKYPGLRLTVRATDIRDSIEFSRILTSEDDKDFIAFLEARPNSKWSASARIKLHFLSAMS